MVALSEAIEMVCAAAPSCWKVRCVPHPFYVGATTVPGGNGLCTWASRGMKATPMSVLCGCGKESHSLQERPYGSILWRARKPKDFHVLLEIVVEATRRRGANELLANFTNCNWVVRNCGWIKWTGKRFPVILLRHSNQGKDGALALKWSFVEKGKK